MIYNVLSYLESIRLFSFLTQGRNWYYVMTFCQFLMFHDFSMTIFILQVFQSLWEPCY